MMAYDPTQWNNGGPPGISAERLIKIEIGIKDAHDTADGAASAISTHASRTDNPHNVTKSQVGLGSVQNYGVASQAQAEAGSANNVYMTPLRTKNYVDTRLLNNLQFRLNAGQLEYNDGGVWKIVGPTKVGKRRSTTANGVNNSYVTVLDITGVKGRVERITAFTASSGATISLRVTIDGVVEEISMNTVGTSNNLVYLAQNTGGSIQPASEPIYFNNSLKVELYASGTTSSSASVDYALELGTP